MGWTNIVRAAIRGDHEFAGLDPYATWSLTRHGKQHLFQSKELVHDKVLHYQVLLELQENVTPDKLEALIGEFPSRPEMPERRIAIPPAYRNLPENLRNIKHVTAIVTKDFFHILSNFPEVHSVLKRVTLSRPVPQEAMRVPLDGQRSIDPRRSSERRATSPGGANVVVGIIDDGIAFGHERFRDKSRKTRIASIWLQDGFPECDSFDYGREINQDSINRCIEKCTHKGGFEEDTFYRLMGVGEFTQQGHKPVMWRKAHGTHVLDLAAGPQPKVGELSPLAMMYPDWRIICVQLPVATTADTSGASLAANVVDGIWHILNRSSPDDGATYPNVVINLSYGMLAGPHDGTSHLECAIDDITSFWEHATGAKVSVMIPSGNSHLSRIHACIERHHFDRGNGCVDLPWRILPDDRTPSYLEVWLPHRSTRDASPVELMIVPPDGDESDWIGSSNPVVRLTPENSDDVVCQASYEYVPASGRALFLVIVGPTASLPAVVEKRSLATAPFGLWKVKLRRTNLHENDKVNAWIQRDDTPFGYRTGGRQSYFDDPFYRRFDAAGREIEDDHPSDKIKIDSGAGEKGHDSIVKRAGSMNALATGVSTIVLGGLLGKEQRLAKYSAGGPIELKMGEKSPHRHGPDAVAVSDDTAVRAGTLAAGTRSGSMVAMNGTSVAAPLITRWIAVEFAAGRAGDRRAVRALAAANASENPVVANASGKAGRSAMDDSRCGAGSIRNLPPHHPLRLSKR
jgi:Subtilase family